MWAEQAVFTSLVRRGRGGYHLVSRSRGVDETDAQALARWAPSHGALIVDGRNRTSVNFHPLPSGRFAPLADLRRARRIQRPGRAAALHPLLDRRRRGPQAVGFQPFSIYRDAMAFGCLLYQPDPSELLEPVPLSQLHPRRDAGSWADRAAELGLPPLGPLRERLQSGHPLRFAYSGDRKALAECLMGILSPEEARRTGFSTSLVPSSVRPSLLVLVNEDFKENPSPSLPRSVRQRSN